MKFLFVSLPFNQSVNRSLFTHDNRYCCSASVCASVRRPSHGWISQKQCKL